MIHYISGVYIPFNKKFNDVIIIVAATRYIESYSKWQMVYRPGIYRPTESIILSRVYNRRERESVSYSVYCHANALQIIKPVYPCKL